MHDQQRGWPKLQDSAVDPVTLVAVVNSFNRKALFEASLASLTSALRQLPFRTAIVVFEAGSTDGSAEWLRAYQSYCDVPEISIVMPASSDDTSFAAGVNAGCLHAISRYPRLQWLFLFETDNLIAGSEPVELATRLLNFHAQIGAAGFTVTRRSGEPTGFGCSFPTVPQFLMGQQLAAMLRLDRPRMSVEPLFDGYRWGICDVVFTSPLLIKRTAWEESGGLDAAMFPFADCDLDWCRRAQQNGWKMAVIELKGVIHDNEDQSSAWSSQRVLAFHRARFQLLQRHLRARTSLLKIGLFVRHVIEFAALALASPLLSHPGGSLKKRWLLITTVMHNYRG
jgi:GT2 family glycosyltransferase